MSARRDPTAGTPHGRRLVRLFLASLLAVGGALAGEPPPEDPPGERPGVETLRIPTPVGPLGATLYRPKAEGLRPLVVLPPGATVLGRDHALYVALGRYLSERGYIVLVFDFRGSRGSPVDLAFRTVEDFDFVADLLAVVDHGRGLAGVDPERIYVVGHSRGAGIALHALSRGLEVDRMVAIAPPRRIPELLAAPTVAIEGHGAKLSAVMELEPFDEELTRALVWTWAVDRVLELESHPPLLFVDGTHENAIEKLYLEDIYARLDEPKQYARIYRAGHYFGVDHWRDGVRTPLYHDAAVMTQLADVIHRFLEGRPMRKGDAAP